MEYRLCGCNTILIILIKENHKIYFMEESLSEWIKFSLFSDMTNNSYLNIKSYKSLNFIIIYLKNEIQIW